jgi:hypothetical protein
MLQIVDVDRESRHLYTRVIKLWAGAFGAMSKETQRSSDRDRLDWDVAAADALELARQMAPGPERNEALKLASSLRVNADGRGVIFAKRGRPRK